MKTQGDRSAIRLYMPVLAMDASVLGHVFAVGRRFLALERGTFRPREWRASLDEVARVDERGVWLKHGPGALEPVFGFFSGPIARYRPAADASPIHEWTGFDPPAVDEIGEGSEEQVEPGISGEKPEDPGRTVH